MLKRTTSAMFLVLILFVFSTTPSNAQVTEAPANVAAALVVKILGFEKNIGGSGDVTIYVLGAADVESELKKGVGKPIGGAVLKEVTSGNGLPGTKPSVLFIGDAAKQAEVTRYCQANKVLSITSIPDLVSKGITLGFGVGDDGKPKILLNLTSSVEEGLDWNPAIMKVAQTIK